MTVEEQYERQNALDRAESAYQDLNSPHYRDNERYSWAVKTINENYANPINKP